MDSCFCPGHHRIGQVQACHRPRHPLGRRGRQLRQDAGLRRPGYHHQQGHRGGVRRHPSPPHWRDPPRLGLLRLRLLTRGLQGRGLDPRSRPPPYRRGGLQLLH